MVWVNVLPATVKIWPPVPSPAAIALPAATTISPVPALMILGEVTLPVPEVLTTTPALAFCVMVNTEPSIEPLLVALPLPAVTCTEPVPLLVMVLVLGAPHTGLPASLKILPLLAMIETLPSPFVTATPRNPRACSDAFVAVPVILIPPEVALVTVTPASKPIACPLADEPTKVMPVPDR